MAGGPLGRRRANEVAAARVLLRGRARGLRPSLLDLAAWLVGASVVAVLGVSAARAAWIAGPSTTDEVPPRVVALVAGLVVVVGLAAALSSGERGGPLAIAGPMVVLALLAPVHRGAELRMPAVRHVVVAIALGAVVAGTAWIAFANEIGSPRASPAAWILAGSLAGMVCAGVALAGAGLRLSGRAAAIGQAVVAGWWLVDAALETATSPMAAIARMLVVAPSAAGVAYVGVLALLAAAVGVGTIGGLSLEKAWRRSGSADQLRVALGLNDLRTAVLILRRRANETPRSRPWARFDGRWAHRHPIATRSMRSLLRWPLRRVARFVFLAAVTGGLVVAASDLVALVGLVAVVIYAAALDACDALAQELDHPDLQRGYPLSADALAARHVVVPMAVMTVFCVVASAVAGALQTSLRAGMSGAMVSPLVALAAVAGATLTATRTARPLTTAADLGLPPEVVAPRIAARVAAPVVPLVTVLVPVLVWAGSGPGDAAVASLPGGVVSAVVLLALLQRSRLRRARPRRSPPPPTPGPRTGA